MPVLHRHLALIPITRGSTLFGCIRWESRVVADGLACLARYDEHRDSSGARSCRQRQAPASGCWHGDDGRELEAGRSGRRKLLGERAATVEPSPLDTQYQRAAMAQLPQHLHAEAAVRALAAAVHANAVQLLLPPDVQPVVVEEVSDQAGRWRRRRYPRQPGQPWLDALVGLIVNGRRGTALRRQDGCWAHNVSSRNPACRPADRRENAGGNTAKTGSKARPSAFRSDHSHTFQYTGPTAEIPEPPRGHHRGRS